MRRRRQRLTQPSPSSCYHLHFRSAVTVTVLWQDEVDQEKGEEPIGYMADVVVNCAECGEPMVFCGIPAGVTFEHPTVSTSGQELRTPLTPALKTRITRMGLYRPALHSAPPGPQDDHDGPEGPEEA